jgi:hypothetical protein
VKITKELVVGDTVATRKVSPQFVTRAGPGGGGAWRTIDRIDPLPGESPSFHTHLILFTDGTIAAAQAAWYWRTKESQNR